MLNTKKDNSLDFAREFLLFRSGKSCYVMARVSLQLTPFEYFVPGFMLMQQSLENLIKALLKKNEINWHGGRDGHNFIKLLQLGANSISFFQEKFLNRGDFCDLLNELNEGYTAQRYGESGHFIEGFEKMMDLFDEMVFLLVEEFGKQTGRQGEALERLVALPIHVSLEKTFQKKIKQPFVFVISDREK